MQKSAWVTIWQSPRATIRKIVAKDERRGLWWLAGIYGFAALCSAFQSLSLGSLLHPLLILLFAIVFAPIWGFVFFAIWSAVVAWTGRIFKGTGSFGEIRAAYAWSCVPMIVSDLVWLLLFILFGASLFISPPVEQTVVGGPAIFLLALLLVKVVCAIWSLVIYLNALVEVQKYSMIRAIGNVIVAMLLLGIALGVICSGLAYVIDLSLPQTHPLQVVVPGS
jgi:hypothetical protein